MINQSSIKYISSLLNSPESVNDGDQSSISLFRQTFPYFIPTRYLVALETHRKSPFAAHMLSAIQPYMGDWILFCDFLNEGSKVPREEMKSSPLGAQEERKNGDRLSPAKEVPVVIKQPLPPVADPVAREEQKQEVAAPPSPMPQTSIEEWLSVAPVVGVLAAEPQKPGTPPEVTAPPAEAAQQAAPEQPGALTELPAPAAEEQKAEAPEANEAAPPPLAERPQQVPSVVPALTAEAAKEDTPEISEAATAPAAGRSFVLPQPVVIPGPLSAEPVTELPAVMAPTNEPPFEAPTVATVPGMATAPDAASGDATPAVQQFNPFAPAPVVIRDEEPAAVAPEQAPELIPVAAETTDNIAGTISPSETHHFAVPVPVAVRIPEEEEQSYSIPAAVVAGEPESDIPPPAAAGLAAGAQEQEAATRTASSEHMQPALLPVRVQIPPAEETEQRPAATEETLSATEHEPHAPVAAGEDILPPAENALPPGLDDRIVMETIIAHDEVLEADEAPPYAEPVTAAYEHVKGHVMMPGAEITEVTVTEAAYTEVAGDDAPTSADDEKPMADAVEIVHEKDAEFHDLPAGKRGHDPLIFPIYTGDYFLQQGEKISDEIPLEINVMREDETFFPEDKSLMVVMSFTEWLLHFKKSSEKQKEETKDQRALKTMWQKEKLAAAMEEENEEIPESVFAMAVNSISKEEGLVSETLAEIHMKQGKYEKAVEMYRKLSLINPQKSAYFAVKIDEALKDKES